ncbi:MAG: PD-(D/E)XK nuclease family protein, partial [Deltaproteobacteria bacterium]
MFVGWDRPLLPGAVDHLCARHLRGAALDLRRVVIVVPGARAGRRLLELLVETADREHAVLGPPRIVTLGSLPELLVDLPTVPAESVVRNIAWVRALRDAGPLALRPVVVDVPRDDDWLGWSLLGEVVDRLHTELAGHDVDFTAVAQKGLALETFEDAPRWMTLAAVQRTYARALETLGFEDPQHRRARAVDEGRCRFVGELVLVGVAELQPLVRRVLDALDARAEITALVPAPEDLAARFDAYGCIVTAQWTDHPLTLAPEQIDVVDRPADQATAVIRALARWEGRYGPTDVVIGVPDERVIPQLEQHLAGVGVPVRAGRGVPLETTRTMRLLAVLADVLEHGRVRDFAALVRHPDAEHAARSHGRGLARADVLTALDAYLTDHVPAHLPAAWIANAREPERAGQLNALRRTVEDLVAPLRVVPRSLHAWGRPLLDVLVAIQGTETLDARSERDRLVIEACTAVRDLFDTLEPIPPEALPTVTAAEAIRWIERQLATVAIPPASNDPAVELLGWLELPVDDTPALIVTGMNEGIVPESVNADQFLPNALRRQLGLVDNDQRHARDVFAMQRLLSSRERVHVITARRTGEGDPLAPSRLLLACEPAILAARVRTFYRDEPGAPVIVSRGRWSASVLHSSFRIPRPRPLEKPFESLRVTSFRDYLACPYRFYLRHGLNLDTLDDCAVELDPRRFGTLAHDTLEAFGRHALRDATDPETIRGVLDAQLDLTVTKLFARDAGPAVQVQVEQLRVRLHEFASWQARWASDGWTIVAVESALERAALDVDHIPMAVRGRVDRVDMNTRTGEWVVFDYKTSDTPKSPEHAHRKQGAWT